MPRRSRPRRSVRTDVVSSSPQGGSIAIFGRALTNTYHVPRPMCCRSARMPLHVTGVDAMDGDQTATTRFPVVDFDLFEATSRESSDGAWREVREQCPVAWTERNGGHWIVSGYDEVATAFRDWE